jgi:hypothetical protein
MHCRTVCTVALLALAACNKTPPEPEPTAEPVKVAESKAEPSKQGSSDGQGTGSDDGAGGGAKVANPHAANPHAPNPHAGDPHAGATGAPGAAPKLGIEWTDPAGWTRKPSKSRMRAATLEVPAAKGDKEPGELSVFYFGAQMGGDVEQNIQRWIKQFGDVPKDGTKRSERKVGVLQQHVVEVSSGTYAGSMMGGPPKENFGMVGAVVVAPTGKYFFKLIGPKATVAEARGDFFALLDSMKPTTP